VFAFAASSVLEGSFMHETAADGAYGSLSIGWIDAAIILAYLVGIVGVGCWAGFRRKNHEGDSYFLGGRTLTWPVIGAALFASNISTVHMVSLAECGYKSGLLYGNFEWMAPFTLICLSLFFAPFYIRSNITTLPDFLEKRYSRASRDWLTLISIMAAIVIHIGFAFYAGARVLHGMFGIDTNVCIFVVAGLAGLYTIVGGLLAVMWTESIQTIILLVGAISITVLGLQHVGGWEGLQQSVHPVNFSLIRPSSDPTGLSKWAVFLGYPVIGLWYWCCDQVIVQRVLAAKDENHARIGPLFTGFIKILPMFIFVLPGLICLAMVNRGLGAEPLEDPKDTLTYLINHILPTGMKGVMAAALLAAMMGSVSAALNSIATVFSYDVVKRWRPDTSEHRLVLIGRIVTGVAMGLAILWSPFVGSFETIFQGANDLICYMAPPVTAVFLLGVFWRKASSKAALITMLSGSCIGAAVFVVDFFKIGQWSLPFLTSDGGSLGLAWTEKGPWSVHSMITGFFMFLLSIATLIAFSNLFPDKETAERNALVWKNPLDPLRGKSWRWLGNYRFVAALLFLTMLGLYWTFSGGENYYPVNGRIVMADGTPVVGARVAFECDEPRFMFTQVTGPDGRFVYGSKAMAGGAPAGTYRIKMAPSDDAPHPTTPIPAKYGSFDSSGLQFLCEPKQNELTLVVAATRTIATKTER
jgi:solute:Na+ symporter, SSS family